MKVFIVPVTPFQQNCSVLICERTNRAAFVDPGGDVERLEQVLTEQGATLEKNSANPRAYRPRGRYSSRC